MTEIQHEHLFSCMKGQKQGESFSVELLLVRLVKNTEGQHYTSNVVDAFSKTLSRTACGLLKSLNFNSDSANIHHSLTFLFDSCLIFIF